MSWEYVKTKKEIPPIGKRVKVIPWKMEIWLNKYNLVVFDSEIEYYGKLTRVLTYSGTILVWDTELFPMYHFPIEAFSQWVKEIFEPIRDRFEILDL